MVLADHIVDGWREPANALSWVPQPILSIPGHGWLGVDLFFVLSGFLITGILLDSRDNPHYFRNFYARRFLRIFPLYYTVLLITWLCYPGFGSYFLLSLFYLSNFAYSFHAPKPHGPGIYWSLAVEEHFYICWPLLVRLLNRKTLTALALALVAGVPLLRFYYVSHGGNLVNEIGLYTWFRVDGLALGALLAIWTRSSWADGSRSLKLALALVALSIAITVAGVPFGTLKSGSVFRYTQMELLFAAFLLWAVTLRGSKWTSPLRWSFAKLSGDLSYCIYLIHLSVGDAYEYFVHRFGWQTSALLTPFGAFALRSIFMVVVTFALAMLSRRFLERPMLRLKRYFEYAPQAAEQTSRAS